MYWNEETNAISISAGDVKIMRQCNISMERLLQKPENPQLPPVWSILSYAMLRSDGQVPVGIWRNFRLYQKMFDDPDLFYYRREIIKRDGSVRELNVPMSRLRYEQEFVFRHILSKLPVDSHAYAYRKGVAMKECARPHVGKAVVIRLDLQDFFGSVTEDMVYRRLLEDTGYPRKLCRFLARICCYKHHLSQGAVTSPMLSNLVFRPMDEKLGEFAGLCGMTYTRYSDDLYFSGDEIDATSFIGCVKMILRTSGFRVNEKKTKVLGQQHRQTVLGLTVNEKLQVTRAYRRNLLQEVYYLEKFGKNCLGAQKEGSYLRYAQRLLGKVNYAIASGAEDPKLQAAAEMLKKRIFLIEREFY